MKASDAAAILASVAAEFRIPPEKIVGPSRRSIIVHARRTAAKELVARGASHSEAAIVLRRDRSTVSNLVNGAGYVEREAA